MKIILLLLILFATGCEKQNDKYLQTAEELTKAYQNKSIDYSKIDSQNLKYITDIIEEIQSNVNNVLIDDFFEFNHTTEFAYRTDQPNSNIILMKDNKCYTDYRKIVFKNAADEHASGDYESVLYCKGYIVKLLQQEVLLSLENNYISYDFVKIIKNKNSYHYYYKGNNDKNIRIEFIEEEAVLKEVNWINDVEIPEEKTSYLIPILILITFLGLTIGLFINNLKKQNENT